MFNSYYTLQRDKDFSIDKSIKVEEDRGDFIKAGSAFSDKTIPNSLGLSIQQSLSTFKSNPENNALFLDYNIKNTSGRAHDTLRVGIYADWDIIDSMDNSADYSHEYKMGYAYYPADNMYAGLAIISDQNAGFQTVSLYDNSWNFVFGSDISEQEKFDLLQNDDSKHSLSGVNVANVLSATIVNLGDQEEAKVQFVIVAGSSVEELKEKVINALLISSSYTKIPEFKFCAGDAVVVNPSLGDSVYFYSDSLMTNFLGMGDEITLDFDQDHELFMIQKGEPFYKKYKALVDIEENIGIDFSINKMEIVLEANKSLDSIFVQDNSKCAVAWEWSVNNKIISFNQSAYIKFDSIGTYSIMLKAWNTVSTVDSLIKTFAVLTLESDFTSLAPFSFCVGDTISINPNLGDEVEFFDDSLLTNFIARGDHVLLDSNSPSDTLYMKNKEGLYYKKYRVDVQTKLHLETTFLSPVDSIHLSPREVSDTLIFKANSPCAVRWEWTVNNEIVSSEPEARMVFDHAGSFAIKLKVWDKLNNTDSVIQVVVSDVLTGVPGNHSTKIQVFPNPTSGLLNIKLAVGSHAKISLSDQLGRLQLNREVYTHAEILSLDLSALIPGLYFLHITEDKKNFTTKVIVR